MNLFHPPAARPAAQPVLAVNNGALHKAIPPVPPLALVVTPPPNQAVLEDVELPTQPFENDVMMFLDE